MDNPIPGLGILKGLGVTLKHFIDTYLEDIRWRGKRYYTPDGIQERVNSREKGIFTVQYPEEKLPIPEEFRYLPFLIYELDVNGKHIERCTSCGICAKVCPPQCIWIVRQVDAVTNKPVAKSAEYTIDMDLCMGCGYCAEYCPFDAIKMDHDFEVASYDRKAEHIYSKEKLLKPVSYYASIRPLNFAKEEAEKAEKSQKAGKKVEA